jgi:hypothetical protein
MRRPPCSRLECPSLIAIAGAMGCPTALVAATPEDVRLFLRSSLLEHALHRQRRQRTQQLLSTIDIRLALQQGGQPLCFDGAWRYLLWHMRVRLLLRRVIMRTG